MKKILPTLIASILLTSTPAFAALCTVNLNSVLINADSTVNVKHTGRNEYTYICSLKEPRLGVDVTTCAMWTSMLLNLKSLNKQATFYYNTPCDTLPIYDATPAPVYIGTTN